MRLSIIDVLGTAYVLSGLVAVGLLWPGGLRTIRLVLQARRPRSTIGWIFAPLWLALALALSLIALYFVLLIWPVFAVVVWQRRRRLAEIERGLDAEEEEELLREARRARQEEDDIYMS